MKGLILAIALAVPTVSYASGYSKFYRPAVFTRSAAFIPSMSPPEIVEGSGDPARDADRMFADGYAPIGYSSFTGMREGPKSAIAQAKKVAARYVILSVKSAGSINLQIPTFNPTTQTTNVSGTVGSTPFSGSATSYGSSTSYMPLEVDRYEQQAVYFGEVERRGVGAFISAIEPDQAARVGTNHGVIVRSVRRGSPAYQADILPGDVIQKVGDAEVYDGASFGDTTRAMVGSTFKVSLLRGGSAVIKELTLSADGHW